MELHKLGFEVGNLLPFADDVIPLLSRLFRLKTPQDQKQQQPPMPLPPQIKLAADTTKILQYLLGVSQKPKQKYLFFNPQKLPTPSYLQETSGARPVDMIQYM